MIYSKDPKFIFIHIPKTAGTSIEEALYHYQDFSLDDGNIHQPMVQHRDYLNREDFDDYFKFCFVRNPFDLMYSTWVYWTRNNGFNIPFEDWIIWRHEGRMMDGLKYLDKSAFNDIDEMTSQLAISWYMNRAPQTYWFVDERGRFLADFIGSFEYIAEDFKTIVNHLELTDIFLPHSNSSRSSEDKDYRRYYTDRTRKIIEEEYAIDLAIFGYSFDNSKPDHKNFGFVKEERNSISKFNLKQNNGFYINHSTMPYGFSQNIVRHNPGPEFESQLHEFETEKLRKRANSLRANIEAIYLNIKSLENELLELDESNDYIEKQQIILRERELELSFKLKLSKVEKELERR